jgi:hypothetical protein
MVVPHAEGYALAHHDGLMAYILRVRAGDYRLVLRRGAGHAHGAGVPDQAQPFVVDLGTDAAGRAVAVYPRGLRVIVLDLATRVERTVARTATVARGIAVNHGSVTYATVHDGQSTIRRVPADGSARPRVWRRVSGYVTTLDTSRHGLAYVLLAPTPGQAHSTNELIYRGRQTALTGYGEEGGADIVSVSFTGVSLVWAVSGQDESMSNFGSVERLNLRTGRRTTLRVPRGGLIAAAPDAAHALGPTLVAFEPGTPEPGFGPDPDREVLRRYPWTAYAPPAKRSP